MCIYLKRSSNKQDILIVYWIILKLTEFYRYNKTMIIYKKLVRDNIPGIIEKEGKTSTILHLDDETFLIALKEKLVEEAREALQATSKTEMLSELADLQEVMDKLKELYDIEQTEVNMAQAVKAIKNGKFDQQLFLVSVEE